MKCLADFEVISELAVSEDGKKLNFSHPAGHYECFIKNKSKEKNSSVNLLRMQLLFDAEDIQISKEICVDYIIDSLNILSFITNSRFEFNRMIQIFDWTPGLVYRDGLIFSGPEPDDDPTPLLDQRIMGSVEAFLQSDTSAQITDALRWFRLGVSSASPEEQFQNFWFAIEIVAQDQKKPEKVHDQCPHCNGPLYCEACGTHPMHKPYPKQAIAQLFAEQISGQPDFFEIANIARNAIMHGHRLKTVEDRLPCTSDHLVDLLGKLAWNALVNVHLKGLPEKFFPFEPALCVPNFYVRMKLGAAVHLRTVVPNGPDGQPDIEQLVGLHVKIVKGDADGG